MNVTIEKKDVEITEDMDFQLIIGQSLEPGTTITISEDVPAKITLYIPNVYEQYPDFVKEGWTVGEVEEFAKKYNLVLDIKYVESTEYADGTIINQSRTGKIVEGASLTITVTHVKDEIVPSDDEEILGDDEENNE